MRMNQFTVYLFMTLLINIVRHIYEVIRLFNKFWV